MRKPIPMRASRSLRALGPVVVAAVLSGDLAAAEPPSRAWPPRPPVPPYGPFFGVPAIPGPVPFPLPPELAERGVTGPTDRCLVIPSPIDPRSLKTAAAIDPGIFAAPRVQGLAIRPAGWRAGRRGD